MPHKTARDDAIIKLIRTELNESTLKPVSKPFASYLRTLFANVFVDNYGGSD